MQWKCGNLAVEKVCKILGGTGGKEWGKCKGEGISLFQTCGSTVIACYR